MCCIDVIYRVMTGYGTEIEIKDLRKQYRRIEALRGLNLQIPANSTCAFIGSNGAGKTTTFSIIGGFVRRDGGQVLVNGVGLERYRSDGGCIGALPQDARFFPVRSVAQQLMLLARLTVGHRGALDEVERVVELTDLSERLNQDPRQLSHGLRVRLGIAQALLGRPALLLLDEPSVGLDPRALARFRAVIDRIAGETTIVISSHNLRELEETCDYVCMIEKGQLVAAGPMKLFVQKVSKVKYYLGVGDLDLEDLGSAVGAVDLDYDSEELTLSVEFNPKERSVEELNALVLRWLLDRGVPVREIAARRHLEDSFLEATLD